MQSGNPHPSVFSEHVTEPGQHNAALAPWQVYQDAQSGLAFQYPPGWGNVTRNNGNRKEEGSICPDPVGGPLAAAVQDDLVLPIYDTEYTFSNLQVTVHVLSGLEQHPYILFCKRNNSGIDTTEDRTLLSTGSMALTLQNGGTAYEFLNLFDTANDDEDNQADVYADPVFILYHNGARYEIYLRLTIPGSDLAAAGCLIPPSGMRDICGKAWLVSNPAAKTLRSEVDDIRRMVTTMTFGS